MKREEKCSTSDEKNNNNNNNNNKENPTINRVYHRSFEMGKAWEPSFPIHPSLSYAILCVELNLHLFHSIDSNVSADIDIDITIRFTGLPPNDNNNAEEKKEMMSLQTGEEKKTDVSHVLCASHDPPSLSFPLSFHFSL
eukprot:gene13439-9250_t